MLYFLMILSCAFLNAAIQLFLKTGMQTIGHFEFCFKNIGPFFLSILGNPSIILGVLLQPLTLGIWLLVLSRVDVTYAFPLVSLSYIFTALGGHFLLNEPLSLILILGILTIMGGVCLVARS